MNVINFYFMKLLEKLYIPYYKCCNRQCHVFREQEVCMNGEELIGLSMGTLK